MVKKTWRCISKKAGSQTCSTESIAVVVLAGLLRQDVANELSTKSTESKINGSLYRSTDVAGVTSQPPAFR